MADVLGWRLEDALAVFGEGARVTFTGAPGRPQCGTARVVAVRENEWICAYFHDGAPKEG